MNKLIRCVEALKNVRRSMQSDADSCVLTALDEVITDLERWLADNNLTESETTEAGLRALAVLSDILTC